MSQPATEARERDGPEKPARRPVPGGRLLTLFQACAYIGLSEWKLRALVHDGRLPIVELNGGEKWWLDRRDLDALVDRNKKLL
jgi:excisionase family DNA binding protein